MRRSEVERAFAVDSAVVEVDRIEVVEERVGGRRKRKVVKEVAIEREEEVSQQRRQRQRQLELAVATVDLSWAGSVVERGVEQFEVDGIQG